MATYIEKLRRNSALMVCSNVRFATFLGEHNDLGKLCSLFCKDMHTPRPVKGANEVETCVG